jgi:hypothetical protein
MLRLLLSMHHIALCTQYIAFLLVFILVHFVLDHAEPKSEIQVEQIQRSVVVHKHQVERILTLLWIKTSSNASNSIIEFCFS